MVESADGTEHAFTLTTHAAGDAGEDLAADTEKGRKVAVYSTQVVAGASRTASRRFRHELFGNPRAFSELVAER